MGEEWKTGWSTGEGLLLTTLGMGGEVLITFNSSIF